MTFDFQSTAALHAKQNQDTGKNPQIKSEIQEKVTTPISAADVPEIDFPKSLTPLDYVYSSSNEENSYLRSSSF
ncbi:MAG: hypothetical protein QM752_01715 [Gammaproteobacteria bacterium]